MVTKPISTGVDMINLGEPSLTPAELFVGKENARTIRNAWSPEEYSPEIAGLTIEQASAKITPQLESSGQSRNFVSPSWWGELPYVSFRMTMVVKIDTERGRILAVDPAKEDRLCSE